MNDTNTSQVRELIIIGSGPAGYAAAVYAARAQLEPLMFAGEKFGGQLMFTTEVENYPGFKEGIMGPKLMTEMREQAKRFETEIIDKNIVRVDFDKHPFRVWHQEGEKTTEHQSRSVIISTGAEALTLKLPKEKELMGRGVSVCAVCDAAFYKDKVAYVVGGGDAAVEEVVALTKFASKTYLAVRRDTMRASKIMQERVLKNDNVEVLWNTEVIELMGQEKLEGLVLENNNTGEKKEVAADGLFYAIGHKPITGFLEKAVALDEKGFVLTALNGLEHKKDAENTWLEGFPTMTSIDGVFAAGDVVDFRYRQAITAAGYGCMAALDAEKWLEEKRESKNKGIKE